MSAVISKCGEYRYLLKRQPLQLFPEKGPALFVAANIVPIGEHGFHVFITSMVHRPHAITDLAAQHPALKIETMAVWCHELLLLARALKHPDTAFFAPLCNEPTCEAGNNVVMHWRMPHSEQHVQ